MFELRKGKSMKSYENEFFRLLATLLTNEFDKRGWNGLLMGMPTSLEHESLQIDCMLVTDDQIIIIDFKNYGGYLLLPEAEAFNYGQWRINGETTVKGGSSINPYKQLGKQRAKLVRVLEKKISNFDRSSIFTLVCFHNQVNVLGEVPSNIIGFGIADSKTILNKIVDIVDVESGKCAYLNPAAKDLFIDKLFFAPEYELSIELDFDEIIETKYTENVSDVKLQSDSATKSLEIAQESTYDIQFQDFLTSNDRVLIVSGNIMSGKTGLIPRIRKIAFDKGYYEVPVYAYSNKIKTKMLKNHPEIEEVDSLFGEIFDFENEKTDENYKKIIPVKINRDNELLSQNGGELFIIDDSQLLSNSFFNSDFIQFGTGCLLDDLFEYLQFKVYPNRRVVFIGDTNLISYGSNMENAMNADFLDSFLNSKGIFTNIRRIILPPRQDVSEIVNVCNKISECINAERFSELIITNNTVVRVGSTDNQIAILEATYKAPDHNKIIVYTNEQANRINFWIKKNLVKNGPTIGLGDVIVFNSTIRAYTPRCLFNEESQLGITNLFFYDDEPKRIDNGSFARVISVDLEGSIKKTSLIDGQIIALNFIPCQVKLLDSSILQIYVYDNYLQANKVELEPKVRIAYQEALSSMLRDFMSKHSFEDSDEYKRMNLTNDECLSSTGKPYFIKNAKGEYRLEMDGRSLPSEIKEFRKRIENILLNDDSSDYFKVYNAASIKYAWAITVNKAIAYTFENVYFKTDQGENHGRTNKDYFKWLYSGFAIAKNKIELINWIPISPFMNTEFNKDSRSSIPKSKDIIFQLSSIDETKNVEFENFIENSFSQTNWKLVDISSRRFLEIVKLQRDEKFLELFFDYNNNGEVKAPRLKNGCKEDFEEVFKIIKSVIGDANAVKITEKRENLESVFSQIIEIFRSKNINTMVVNALEWSVYFKFSKENLIVDVQCWYNSHDMISKFNHINGSEVLFDEITLIIKEIYSL